MTIVRDSFYINGEWVKATSSDTLEVTTSGTGELYATVPAGTDRGGQSGRRSGRRGVHRVGQHQSQGAR